MRARDRLSPAFIRKAPPGKYCDGAGLWLVVREDGGAQWVLRVTVHGRRREMGLGGYPEITLAQARDMADRWRADGSGQNRQNRRPPCDIRDFCDTGGG